MGGRGLVSPLRHPAPRDWCVCVSVKETVNCQSLAFLTAKLPGTASNKEMTQPHQKRLAEILREWDAADESDEAEENEEGDEEDEAIYDPPYALPAAKEGSSEEESD